MKPFEKKNAISEQLAHQPGPGGQAYDLAPSQVVTYAEGERAKAPSAAERLSGAVSANPLAFTLAAAAFGFAAGLAARAKSPREPYLPRR